MFKLHRFNIVKIVDTEVKKNKLIKEGFVEIQTPIDLYLTSDTNLKNNYDSLSYADLKKLASEKGVDTYKVKKDDIIIALQKLEG